MDDFLGIPWKLVTIWWDGLLLLESVRSLGNAHLGREFWPVNGAKKCQIGRWKPVDVCNTSDVHEVVCPNLDDKAIMVVDQNPRTLLNMPFPQITCEKHRWFCLLIPFDPSPNRQTLSSCLKLNTPAEDRSHNCLKHSRARGRLRGLDGNCHLNWISIGKTVLFPNFWEWT